MAFKSPEPLTLTPMNLDSPMEVQDLLHQRRICGWSYQQSDIDHWRSLTIVGTKMLYWIVLPTRSNVRAGHISLASESTPANPKLARLDRSLLTISTFFVLPEYRTLGLGGRAISRLEDEARAEGCEALVIDTMRKEEDTEAWRASFTEKGLDPIKSVQTFYEKRGYVKFWEEARYGDSIPEMGWLNIKAAFLRKELR